MLGLFCAWLGFFCPNDAASTKLSHLQDTEYQHEPGSYPATSPHVLLLHVGGIICIHMRLSLACYTNPQPYRPFGLTQIDIIGIVGSTLLL